MESVKTSIAIALGALSVTAPVPDSAASGAPPNRAYERAIEKALERAEATFLEDVELPPTETTWDEPWVARTRFYEVRTTRSPYFGQLIGQGLDTMVGFYQEALRTDWTPTRPLPVFVLPDLTRYNAFGEQHGAEHSSFYGSFFASQHPERPVAALFDADFVRLRRTITHSALHQYVAGAFPRSQPAPWLVEGLAKYFELHWNFASGIADLEAIRADNRRWIPLRELLNAPLPSYADRTSSRLLQLGALFTYLYSYREDTRTVWESDEIARAPFADYVHARLSGGDFRRLAPHDLLTRRVEELDRELRAFSFE